MQRRATPEDAGARLDAFLAAPLGSRARAQRLIEAGHVLVDGRAAPKRHRLSAGELVTVDEPEEAPAPDVPDAPYAVPYRDEHLLVIDKPAGVVVHPARGHRTGTLAQALSPIAAGGEDAARAGIVHRLDRDTSGLLVVARSEAVHRALRNALQARAITREYLALVEGRPPARSGTIDAPLGRDRRVRTRMSTDTDDPRAAVTHFEIEQALPRTTLLRVRLRDGTHPPDPRPSEGHRPSGRRRPRVRDTRAPGARAPVPARGAAGLRAPGDRGAGRRQLAAARGSAPRRWRWPAPSDPQLGPVGDLDLVDAATGEHPVDLVEELRCADRPGASPRRTWTPNGRRCRRGPWRARRARRAAGSPRRPDGPRGRRAGASP